MSEQKPMSMDTAPKDGTFLGYGCHHANDKDIIGSTGWSEVYYHDVIERWCSIVGGFSHVTAWLPLPPTPTEE